MIPKLFRGRRLLGASSRGRLRCSAFGWLQIEAILPTRGTINDSWLRSRSSRGQAPGPPCCSLATALATPSASRIRKGLLPRYESSRRPPGPPSWSSFVATAPCRRRRRYPPSTHKLGLQVPGKSVPGAAGETDMRESGGGGVHPASSLPPRFVWCSSHPPLPYSPLPDAKIQPLVTCLADLVIAPAHDWIRLPELPCNVFLTQVGLVAVFQNR